MTLNSTAAQGPSNLGLQPDPRPPLPCGLYLATAACLIVALIARLSFLGEPFKNDAGIYIYLGKVLWSGGKLYVDFWETKFPSVPLILAPLYGAFGANWFAYVFLQTAMGIGGAWALAVALRRYVAPGAYAPALLFGLIGLNLSRLTITGFQLETIQSFFEILAAVMVLRSLTLSPATRQSLAPVFAAGLLAGIAMLAKPTGLAVAAAAGCAYLWDARHRGAGRTAIRLLALAFGAIVPLLGVFAWVLVSPFRGEMPGLLREISLYASGTPWRSLLQFKTWIFFVLPFAPVVFRFVMLSLPRSRAATPPGTELQSASGTVVVFALAWVVIEIAAVLVQRRLYGYHFLVLMPPAVLLFAIWPRSNRLWPTLVAIAPVALLSLYFSKPGYVALAAGNAALSPVSRYVIEHTTPTDAVWADPAARLLLETGRPPGARLQMTFYLVNHDQAPQHFGEVLLNDFEQRDVKYLILPVNWRQESQRIARETPGTMWRPQRRAAYLAAIDNIGHYVADHYRLEATVDGKLIYRRNIQQTLAP